VSGNSAYDRYLAGDHAALEPAALRGEQLFLGAAACFHCHPAGALTNEGFFNNGSFVEGGDVGRQAITGRSGDLGKFKVPGLRNVAVSAPYMHDGRFKTLEEVVNFYNKGGVKNPHQDNLIIPLELTDQEKHDLVEFLHTLNGEGWQHVSAPKSFPK